MASQGKDVVTEKLSVVFSSDRKYVPHLATALASLLETNPDFVDRVFVITNESNDKAFAKLRDFVKVRYFVDLELIQISDSVLENFQVTGHISRAAYSRLLVGSLLPVEISRVLYLDCDLVVVGDISEIGALIETADPIAEPEVLAVSADSGQHLTEFGHSGEKYFNSGVMVLNLSKWRSTRAEEKLVSFATAHAGRLHLWDQDVLNVIFEHSWVEIPGWFNDTASGTDSRESRIIHFVGATKPWMVGGWHPHRVTYNFYRSQTPYYPYLKTGLGRFLRKRLLPRWLQKPSRTVRKARKRLSRLLAMRQS